jgi:hypothetical protein
MIAHTVSIATLTMHIQEPHQESGTFSRAINIDLFKAVKWQSGEASKCSNNAIMYICV